MFEVRVVEPDEWPLIKRIRLEALLDTPAAFMTTHAQAVGFPDELWIRRAADGAQGRDQLTVLGLDAGLPIGLAVGLERTDRRGPVTAIVSVYVAPQARGAGVGDRMLGLIEEWGMGLGSIRATLWVEETNARAVGFYERLGYAMTADRAQIQNDFGLFERRMEKPLGEAS